MKAFGGFYATAGVTALNAPAAGVVLTSTNVPLLAVNPLSKEGEASVSETISTGRLSCRPGKYLVTGFVSLEGEHTSATSGDAIGVIAAGVKVAGSLVTGPVAKGTTEAEGQLYSLPISQIVEITQAQADAATPTNYIEIALYATDASGNDVIVRELNVNVIRLDD